MSAVSAPFGLRPAYHPSGLDRAREYPLAANYATAIYKNSPVALVANSINLAAAAADFLGSFDGVTYTDVTGKPTLSNFWPGALSGATLITAFVWDDPLTIFEIQSLGSIPLLSVGKQIDFDATSIGTGSAATGLSTAMCTATLITSGSQGQLRIVDISLAPTNAWGDAFTVLQVQIARSQFVSNKTAV